MHFQVPQSEFLLSFLIQTLSLSCSFLNLFFDCPFFFFCLPKKVVFSFMFGSILSLNSPIYFTSQLINQDYQSFLFLCFHKGHLSMWLYHLSTSFLLYLLGAIVWTLSSGPLLWSFSTAVIIMRWYSCNEIHLSSLLWILISWCVHACVFILVFSCYFCLRISWQHK